MHKCFFCFGRCKLLLLIFLLAYVVVFNATSVMADMVITPTRIIFEDRDRFASVTIANPGDEATTYEMKWRYFRMKEEGDAYEPVEGSITDFDLAKHVIFSPKRVRLAPGASQKIRLALRRPADIPDGDYHIHLGFFPVPEFDRNDVEQAPSPAVAVKINVGYTIPVILRSGKVDVKASIERISLSRNEKNGKLIVNVPIKREGGPYSILGHLIVYHIDDNGNQEIVGEISNAHIFPEVNGRKFDVHLGKNIMGGSLRVVVYRYDYNRNKSDVENYIYTERLFPLE